MHIGRAIIVLQIGLASAAILASAPGAAAQGSQGETFRRHFWRGQAYHGSGYPAQVGEMTGSAAPRGEAVGPKALEAIVEDGTPGAAIARNAASCVARFKSYDASSGTYVGRGARRLRCP